MSKGMKVGFPFETIILFGSVIGYALFQGRLYWILCTAVGGILLIWRYRKHRFSRRGLSASLPLLAISWFVSLTVLSGSPLGIYLVNGLLGGAFAYLLTR